MNIYLYPVYDEYSIRIKTVKARNLTSAEDKVIDYYMSEYEDLECEEYEDLINQLIDKHDITLGDLYEIDEFE